MKRYPKPQEMRFHTVSRPDKYEFFEKQTWHLQSGKRQPQTPYSEVVYNVCQNCNSGWMSRLHAAAKPFISNLADGYWSNFTDEECKIVARWAAMVTFNLEAYSRVFLSREYQRKQLKISGLSGAVPAGFLVTIGRMESAGWGSRSYQRAFQFPLGLGEDDLMTAQTTIFCVESVAFHTTRTDADMLLEMLKYHANFDAVRLPREIWPTNERRSIENGSWRFTMADIKAMQVSIDNWNLS
jgi:hypothetical protein